MNLGQTMLMVMFFGLLIVMFINAYRTLNDADTSLMTSEAVKTATDLGRSLMSEILTKRFDEGSTPGAPQISLTSPPFTAPGSLRPEAGETITLPDRYPYQSIAKYNDVDDYNGYTRLVDSTNGLNGFKDSVVVYYVDINGTKSTSTIQWYKQIEVWITQDPYLKPNPGTTTWLKFYSIVTNGRKG
jgi:hypothetical protein